MTGSWEVYCRHERAVSLDDLQRELATCPTRREGGMLIFTIVEGRTEIDVMLERGDLVRAAVTELADRELPVEPGVPAPDLDALRLCDVCYVLEYDADKHYDVANTLMIIAGNLEKLCSGIICDRTSDRFA